VMRDPFVEYAGERLEAIYSKAQKLVARHFKGIDRYDQSYRIAIMAYMKMLVELIKLEKKEV